MKTKNLMTSLIVATAFSAQTAPVQVSSELEFSYGEYKNQIREVRPQKPNEIKIFSTIYSGIAVHLYKTAQPAQMINPLAPAKYGDGEQNVVRDPITGEAMGLKMFAVNF